MKYILEAFKTDKTFSITGLSLDYIMDYHNINMHPTSCPFCNFYHNSFDL